MAPWPIAGTIEGSLFGPTARRLGSTALLQRLTTHQDGRADLGERLLAVAVLVRWVEEWA
jgi:hypothetical protein